MGKNKKAKNNNVTKEVKNEVREEVKNEKEVVEEKVENNNNNKKNNKKDSKENNNVQKVEKENKKNKEDDQKALDKEAKKKEKEEKKKEKEEIKEAKKEEMKENKEEKALIKKAKKASNNDMKIILGIVFAVILVAFGIFGFYFYKLNSECVATYDGGKVTVADYEVYYKTFAPMLEYYGYPSSIIPEQIVNKAALDQIIVAMAEAEGVQISDEDKASVDEVFNDEEQIATFTEQGIDIGRMRKLYLNDYLISAYLEKLAADAADEDVLAYIKETYGEEGVELDLNQYNTSHILFKTTDDEGNTLSDEEKATKKQQAEAALTRVLNGEDFATVAKELSEDSTKENGGKYTMYDDGYTMEEYAKAVKTLSDGQIYATLVETEAGYHIIKLDSKVENGRAKNETEREEYVDYKVNSLAEERNLVVDEEELNKVIVRLTGSNIESEEDTTTDETTDGTAETTDDTQTTDTTESDDTTQSTEATE